LFIANSRQHNNNVYSKNFPATGQEFMNTLIYYGFNILILSAIVLSVGMYKPTWILIWMDKPGRLPILMIAVAIFMVGMVLYGEGNKQLQQEKARQSRLDALSAHEVPVAAKPKPQAEVPTTTPSTAAEKNNQN
jgi:hypothetical protein